MDALTVADLKVYFGGVRALDGVSVEFGRRGVHAVIGPNGAGKTSLINAVTGIYRPTAGHVTWRGQDVTGLPPHRLARMGLTRTFQNLQVFWNMPVLDNVMCGFHLGNRTGFCAGLLRLPSVVRRERELTDKARALLTSVGLIERAADSAAALPYGELKRLEIARALAAEPDVLFLDEPVAGCNAVEKEMLGKVIRRVANASKTAIVLVEHDMRLVMSISDWITVMDRGRMLAEGTPDAIRCDARVIAAYLGTPADEGRQHALAG
jgi:branched-chain amino acid transport system ATP-binding protein